MNVILVQFFSSQAFWANAYVLCINSKVILRELGTGLGMQGFESDGCGFFFFLNFFCRLFVLFKASV